MRHAVRILRTAPVLSCVVCVLLATGIAANARMYASVEALVWRPFEVEQPERLYALTRDTPGAPVTNALYHALSDDMAPRVTLASFVAMNAPVRATGPVAEAVVAVNASRSYFEVVRPAFLMGRGFSADRGSPEVVISRALWSRAFASRAEALGAILTTHGHPLTIVGVLDGFSGTSVSYDADIFVPLDLLPPMLGSDLAERLLEPGTRVLSVLARPVSEHVRFETIQADVRLAGSRRRRWLLRNTRDSNHVGHHAHSRRA